MQEMLCCILLQNLLFFTFLLNFFKKLGKILLNLASLHHFVVKLLFHRHHLPAFFNKLQGKAVTVVFYLKQLQAVAVNQVIGCNSLKLFSKGSVHWL